MIPLNFFLYFSRTLVTSGLKPAALPHGSQLKARNYLIQRCHLCILIDLFPLVVPFGFHVGFEFFIERFF